MNIIQFKSLLRPGIKLSPIPFTPDMAQAVYQKGKTVTRRPIVYPANAEILMHKFSQLYGKGSFIYLEASELIKPEKERMVTVDRCRYGKVGDLLWVRESVSKTPDFGYAYKGSNTLENEACRLDFVKAGHKWAKWTPNIHMPFEACRSILHIRSVTIHKLHEITEEDAKNEGVVPFTNMHSDIPYKSKSPNYRTGFARIWIAIYGLDSWNSNPYIRRIEFEKLSSEHFRLFFNRPDFLDILKQMNPKLL